MSRSRHTINPDSALPMTCGGRTTDDLRRTEPRKGRLEVERLHDLIGLGL
jgi:hypothetical protein